MAPSVGAFDIDIGYDASTLSLASVSPSDFMGSITLGDAADFGLGDYGFGIVNIALTSFLDTAALDAIQSDTLALAALEFALAGLVPGESTVVDIASVFSLVDAALLANEFNVDSTTLVRRSRQWCRYLWR
jgi:hypothetical protein